MAYLLRREAAERAQALEASGAAKSVHLRLADAYVERIYERIGEPHFERSKQRCQ
ncbi:hypothetical protein ACSBM8_06745 [Sphingomonas sp. ASY06-1R]|uniref:hypothetical protein n=1 Tax=Sphingomonas sp. ASY06-1R TaxID=3445771 RepID=UPI003FA230A9